MRNLWPIVCVLIFSAGCAHTQTAIKEFADDVGGLDPDERRALVQTTKDVSLCPMRHGGHALYISGGANPEFRAGGGEIGYSSNWQWVELKGGVAAYASSAAERLFIGPTASVRLQAPTRIAPFVGIGVFGGYSESTWLSSGDGIDNDFDGHIDEYGETREDFDGAFASVFPEIGVHFWPIDYLRLTASASYHINTEGRNHDFWLVGGSVAFFLPAGYAQCGRDRYRFE